MQIRRGYRADRPLWFGMFSVSMLACTIIGIRAWVERDWPLGVASVGCGLAACLFLFVSSLPRRR